MIQRLELASSVLDGIINLDEAYELCANVTREHSKSFYLSTHFLPTEIRRAIRAFYAFCRATDDMVDQPAHAGADRISLAEWRRLSRLPSGQQRHPILSAWADTREYYGVPQLLIEELIDGCEMDLHVHRYETFDELSQYCYCVASTVGLVSMHIIGTITNRPAAMACAHDAAVKLGIALQLTNILRDVGEDLQRGRIYLPQEDMRRFQYTESDLHHRVVNDHFRNLMRFEMERARSLYDAFYCGIAYLKPEGRLAVGTAISLYQSILGRITDNDFDVFNIRAHLSMPAKLCRVPGIYLRVRRLQNCAAQ
ncbi:MAG TPA: squalene/phytoene synthase family protein [Anaerolineae bacterium]